MTPCFELKCYRSSTPIPARWVQTHSPREPKMRRLFRLLHRAVVSIKEVFGFTSTGDGISRRSADPIGALFLTLMSGIPVAVSESAWNCFARLRGLDSCR
jgi:hypothetical protein